MDSDVRLRRGLLLTMFIIYILFSLVTGTLIPSQWHVFIGLVWIILELACIGIIIVNYYEYGDNEPFI